MHQPLPGGTTTLATPPNSSRACIVASPRLFADAMARTVSLAGWAVDALCSDPSELANFERTLTEDHIVVIVDGSIPAAALGQELQRRRPGQRVLLVGDTPAFAGHDTVQIPAAAGVVDLVRSLERLAGGHAVDRQLTTRHVEILQLVADGHSTEEVGERLGIAAKTVNNHLSSVYRRLRTRNLTQAVLRAARAGLIDVSAV